MIQTPLVSLPRVPGLRGEAADLVRPRSGSRILARQAAPLSYSVRLAGTRQDVRAAQALRFQVFNLELGEGLESSYHTCLDEDSFDAVCEHLLVESEGEVVGTYRLQTGRTAAAHLGYYSEGEFDLTPFGPRRAEILELGRACVARAHRNLAVLGLLWRGVFDFAASFGVRYLIGCGSLASQSEAEGAALYDALVPRFSAPLDWITRPHAAVACFLEQKAPRAPRPPKLLSAYLSLGATICAPPAIDRDFKTIDFLTLLDVDAIPAEEEVCYWGDITFGPHLLRLLGHRRIAARVCFGAPEATARDRKALAARLPAEVCRLGAAGGFSLAKDAGRAT